MKKAILAALMSLTLSFGFATSGFAVGGCCEGKVKSVDGSKAVITCKDGSEITVELKDVKAGDEVVCKDGKVQKKAKKKVEGC